MPSSHRETISTGFTQGKKDGSPPAPELEHNFSHLPGCRDVFPEAGTGSASAALALWSSDPVKAGSQPPS